MTWLTDNPIANMGGPMFLVFYVGFTLVLSITCHAILRALDSTRNLPSPKIPAEPSVHEIAYLRGGRNELLCLLVLELVQRGYLQINGDKIGQLLHHPSIGYLSELERLCFQSFHTGISVRELFDGPTATAIEPLFTETHARALEEGYLLEDAVVSRRRAIFPIGLTMLISLAFYKLVIALMNGRFNLGFLFVITFAAMILLFLVCRRSASSLSARGQEYIEGLHIAYGRFKPSMFRRVSPESIETNLLVMTAIFGFSALQGTPYQHCAKAFSKAAKRRSFANSSNNSGCSAFCASPSSDGVSSSGSDGGSGCGGGCGGCGGD